MRAKRRYLGLFAAVALVGIAVTGAVATAHQGGDDETEDNSRDIKRLIDSHQAEERDPADRRRHGRQ